MFGMSHQSTVNFERCCVSNTFCKPCFDLEDQGVESLRQRHIAGVIPEARVNLYPDALDALEDDYSMPFELPTMEIKLNNLCNLKCRMCNPLDSTSWKDWNQVTEFYKKENNYLIPTVDALVDKPGQYIGPFDNSDNWWASFEKLLPYFRRVEFAGGEPLMDPYHYKILDMLAPYGKNIEIKYNVSYFPLNKQQLMSSPSVCMSPNKNINDNCEETQEEYSSKDGFLYRLFGGILF